MVIPIIPVGPGDRERQRLVRLVRSLRRHEPRCDDYVILHDGVDPRGLAADLAGESTDPGRPVWLENPRRGRGVPSYDGLGCGLCVAYRFVAEQRPGAHAWKIDTDAHVIAPCLERIETYLNARPLVGLAGTVDVDCDGTPRDDAFRRLADVHRKYLRPLWFWTSRREVTSPLFGRGRRFADWYRGVDRVSARRGRYVQGGSYAVNATLLSHWLKAGRLDRPEDWLGSPMAEDSGFSFWAVADGFELGNFNGPGDVFGVKNIGLALPPAELVARGHGVVHSVKTDDPSAEQAIIAALDDAAFRRTQINTDGRR